VVLTVVLSSREGEKGKEYRQYRHYKIIELFVVLTTDKRETLSGLCFLSHRRTVILSKVGVVGRATLQVNSALSDIHFATLLNAIAKDTQPSQNSNSN